MNRTFLLLTCVATGIGWAQFSAAPSTLSLGMRQGQPYPNNSTRYPADQTIAISGKGSWTTTLTGPMSYQCGGPCLSVSPRSGTGPATLTISLRALGAESLPAGRYSATLNVGGAAVPINLKVSQRAAYDDMVNLNGYPNGCVQSNVVYPFPDKCKIPNELPGAATSVVPAVGSVTRDQVFGTDVSRVTPSGYTISYSTVSAFSATAKYLLTVTPADGRINIFDRVTRQKAFSDVPGININVAAWDPTDDDKLWYMDGASIKYRLVSKNQTVTAATYGTASGTRPAFQTISTGGTADITDDRWWVFMSGQTLCAVNLNKLTPAVQESQTRCTSFAGYNITYADFAQVTQVDKESGRRYVVLMAQPQNHLFSIQSGGALVHEVTMPTGPSDITAAAHSTTGQDSDGRQILFWSYYDMFGNKYYSASVFLNKGLSMTQPVEAGGGLRFLYPNDPQNWTTDTHFGCNWRGLCVASSYGNSGGIPARAISAIRTGSTCEVVTPAAHGMANGQSVVVGGVLGVTGAGGVSNIQSTGSNSFLLVGKSCNGTYQAGTGSFVLNVPTATDSPNRGEIVVLRPGHEVRRIAHHRAKPFDNAPFLLGYYATPRASISRDGQFVAFESNWGVPDQSSVWVVATGTSDVLRITASAPLTSFTSATLSYNVPANQPAALVVVSSNPDLVSNLALRLYDGQSAAARKLVVPGLRPSTRYYYRISTGQYSFTGSFLTNGATMRLP